MSLISSTSTSDKGTLSGARSSVYLREAVQEINRLRDLSNELRIERDALACANQKLKYRLSRLGENFDVLADGMDEKVATAPTAPSLDLAQMAEMIKAQLDSLEEFSRKLEEENALLRSTVPSPEPVAAPAPIQSSVVLSHAPAEVVATELNRPSNLIHIPLDKRENPLRLKKEVGPAEGASIFAVRRQHPVRKAGFIKNIFGQTSD